MVSKTESFSLRTEGKGTYEVTEQVTKLIEQSGVKDGVVTIFIAHTSASLVIYENADPSARQDLEKYLEKLVPELDPDYVHIQEGPDDTTSHLRMALTRTSEVIPIKNNLICLGTWQGIFLFEHRRAPHQRTIWVNIIGS